MRLLTISFDVAGHAPNSRAGPQKQVALVASLGSRLAGSVEWAIRRLAARDQAWAAGRRARLMVQPIYVPDHDKTDKM